MAHIPPLPSESILPDPYGAHEPPIYQTSTFTFERAADAAAMFAGERPGFVYTRLGNPTVAAWERRLAELEGRGLEREAYALAFASGMGAISAALLAALGAGDHLVAAEPLYGGTSALLRDVLPRFGIKVTIVAGANLAAMALATRKDRTRVVLIETPANPTLDIVDIRAAARIAQSAGARLFVDNTFATPVYQRPLALGADVVLHSSTKYLGGHGTVVGGAVVTLDREFLAGPVQDLRKLLGAAPSPFDAWLLYQGAKTLELRVQRASETARRLAAELAQHRMVEWVRYPGLADDPGHLVAEQQMQGFGAMIAFGIRGGAEAGRVFMDALALAKRAVSLGCTDTLIEHPASMTHAHVPAEERAKAGITDSLIRVSVGLEPAEDLARDLLGALQAAEAMVPAFVGA
jgi:methionine-gamma-lyase